MRLTGDELEASAPGAGKRADFLLLAYMRGENNPYVLGSAYHTTNVVPETSSGDENQAYPETRVLWHMHVPLHGLMEKAATSLAQALGLPTPREKKAQIKKILDPKTWVHTVLKPPDGTMHVESDTDATMRDTRPTDAAMSDASRAAATMPDAVGDAETSTRAATRTAAMMPNAGRDAETSTRDASRSAAMMPDAVGDASTSTSDEYSDNTDASDSEDDSDSISRGG